MSSGLSDVIEIQTDKLTTMGLNSLKDVTGPGNIVMQFNRMNQQPTDSTQRGEKCFSEQVTDLFFKNKDGYSGNPVPCL